MKPSFINRLRRVPARRSQQGLTLIELMVAMIIGLMIALVAAAALVVSRQGFTAVDASAQLRDNGRFIQDLIQRLGIQSGFRNVAFAATSRPAVTSGLEAAPPPNVFGLNNSRRTTSNTWDVGTTLAASSPVYGSDILVLRFQTSSANADSTESDGTMIDCSGTAATTVPQDRNDRLMSILHIAVGDDGEPSLMCSRSDSGAAPYDSQPLIRGVEQFQVLYGVDGVPPGNTTVPITAAPDSIPERYLRANQLTVAGNVPATYANWGRVRSIRIGMVLRGPPNSSTERTQITYHPLGTSKSSATGAIGSAFTPATASQDPGTTFVAPADGRLRQVLTFTVHLRNEQEGI